MHACRFWGNEQTSKLVWLQDTIDIGIDWMNEWSRVLSTVWLIDLTQQLRWRYVPWTGKVTTQRTNQRTHRLSSTWTFSNIHMLHSHFAWLAKFSINTHDSCEQHLLSPGKRAHHPDLVEVEISYLHKLIKLCECCSQVVPIVCEFIFRPLKTWHFTTNCTHDSLTRRIYFRSSKVFFPQWKHHVRQNIGGRCFVGVKGPWSWSM